MFSSERLADGTRAAGILVLLILAWAVLAPGGFFWIAVLAMGVIGATLATTLLARSRATPSLSQVIADVRAEPGGAAGRGKLVDILRQREGTRP
jgi:hypothetical protein